MKICLSRYRSSECRTVVRSLRKIEEIKLYIYIV